MSHVTSLIAALSDALCFGYAFLIRLWAFWGPRLTDRGFVGAVFANLAVLGVIDTTRVELWQLAVWGAANLFFPLWDSHPAGEKLGGGETGGEAASDQSPAVLTVADVEDTLHRVLKTYVPA